MYVHRYVHIYIHVWAYLCVFIYSSVCIVEYVCIHAHTHTHIYVYIYKYAYIYLCVLYIPSQVLAVNYVLRVGHDSFTRGMTHSHVTWLIYTWHDLFTRDMTHSYVWDMTHSYVREVCLIEMSLLYGCIYHDTYVNAYVVASVSRLLKNIVLFFRISSLV